ncbi:MAG: ABC transporter permease subunit [Clostridia bacterium]|nr:ABC transporter permease subunit [Clostridia bacterium]
MKGRNVLLRALDGGRYAVNRAGVWTKRTLLRRRGEEVKQTPWAIVRRNFFSKKSAVFAVLGLLSVFIFVFIAPLFVSVDLQYTDPLQQNVAPILSLRAMPKNLQKGVVDAQGFSGFSAGLSKDGKVFVWGSTKDGLLGIDYAKLPQEIQDGNVQKLACGKDHLLAVTKDGTVVGWGDNSCGQYGTQPVLNAVTMPDIVLKTGEEVRSLSCGYQSSALVKTDGSLYVWGNLNATKNLPNVQGLTGVRQVAFTNSACVAVLENGKVTTGGVKTFTSAVSSSFGRQADFDGYLADKRAVQVATTNKCVAVLLNDGEVVVSGVFENGEDVFPALQEGEFFVSVCGGTRHFVGVTNKGNAYGWGHNAYGQCPTDTSGEVANAYAGALQTYLTDKNGKLIGSYGLKGYVMGTDGRGRDVFARIVHGGKTTMTIGAVAVLISTVIGVIIGATAGYFGGATDTLLMRITEIFASIPFLPFAMLLSQIIKYYNVAETTRIFIMMLILGALSWTGLARMVRGQVLAEREKEFVLSARAMGISEWKIVFRHVLPNIVSVILVSVTLDFAGCLLTESALSYLGFGVQQPTPIWRNMLNGANNSVVIQNYWWQWLFPALFLSFATVCIHLIGDALCDALDPKNERR